LKRSLPWFAATAFATLVNPWGWNLYRALVLQQHVMELHSRSINEWAPLRWNWIKPLSSFSPRNTSDVLHLLALALVIAVVAGFLQRRPGAALLMLAAGYEATKHVRMIALASCVIVVIAGSMLTPLTALIRERIASPRARFALATVAVAIFAGLALLRSADLLTNHHYLTEANVSSFGAGLSPWFPHRAADFIQREHLPGEVLNTYNEGGYITWALGSRYRDYMDGRAVPFGTAIPQHGAQLLASPLDSDLWQREADHYGINTIIFPLTLDEVSLERLKSDCHSQNWRPVYLDEVSIIFLRQTPQNEEAIRRLAIDCASAPLPHDQLPLSAASFNQRVNAARVLSALGRNPEALSAADNAISIFPDNAHARWYRGNILGAMDRRSEAEKEWLTALALAPNEATGWSALPGFEGNVWFALADAYQRQERTTDATHAMEMVTALSSDPSQILTARIALGQLYLAQGKTAEGEKQLVASLSLSQDQPVVWSSLADLYQHSGRTGDAIHAMQEVIRLSSDPATKSRESLKLARLYFGSDDPKAALQQLDEAMHTAPPELLNATGGRTFSFDIAQGRAAILTSMGDLKQATTFEEQAVQLDPAAADAWTHLAKLYQRQGRSADQQKAEQRSKALLADTSTRSN
jgi:tetratricopeptide (TPR) repeat protein